MSTDSADEFEQHVRPIDDIHCSTDNNRFRLWGVKTLNSNNKITDINPVGITFHYPESWEDFKATYNHDSRSLQSLLEIADRVGIPVIWFGEANIDYLDLVGGQDNSGQEIEFGEITQGANVEEVFQLDYATLSPEEIEPRLQAKFGTDFDHMGGSKSKNKRRKPFQHFSMQFLPTDYSITDIDAFHASSPGQPTSLIELKRTDQTVDEWTPWPDDTEQYYLIIKVANQANLNPYIFKHQKRRIKNDTVRFYDALTLPEPNENKRRKYIPDEAHGLAEEYIGDRGRKIDPDEALQQIRKQENWTAPQLLKSEN